MESMERTVSKDGSERRPRIGGGRRTRRAGRGGMPRIFALVALLLVFAPIACSPAPSQPPVAQPGAPVVQTTATPAPQRVYVAIGASDAFGVGTSNPQKQAWPVVLARTLGDSYRLIDLGIPGATVDLATRDELPITLDAQPEVVTVWLAVNDFDAGVALGTYASELSALLRALASGTHARVYVGNLPDLAFLPYFAHREQATLESEIGAWNTAIAAVCQDENATLVDLYSTWTELASHPEYISSDGFHPSASGAARLAALFATAIVPSTASTAAGAPTPSNPPSQSPQVGAP